MDVTGVGLRSIGLNSDFSAILETRGALCQDELLAQVVQYLRSGVPLAVAPGVAKDLFDPAKVIPGPIASLTDGCWLWPSQLEYYVRTYRVKPPDEFLSFMQARDWTVDRASIDVQRIAEELWAQELQTE